MNFLLSIVKTINVGRQKSDCYWLCKSNLVTLSLDFCAYIKQSFINLLHLDQGNSDRYWLCKSKLATVCKARKSFTNSWIKSPSTFNLTPAKI